MTPESVVNYAIEELGLTEADIRDYRFVRDQDAFIIRQWNWRKHLVLSIDFFKHVRMKRCLEPYTLEVTWFDGFQQGNAVTVECRACLKCDRTKDHYGDHEANFTLGSPVHQRVAWPRS